MKPKRMKDLEKIVDVKRLTDFVSEFREIVDTGKLAQFYCRKLFDLRQIKPFNKKGPDLESSDGKIKFEVKHRFFRAKTPPGMPIDLSSIDYVLYVDLESESLLPKYIFQIKKDDITYTNRKSKRVSFKRAFEEKKYKVIFEASSSNIANYRNGSKAQPSTQRRRFLG